MDKILMCRRLQRKHSKPNFFSTPKLEKATVVAYFMGISSCISFILWLLHRFIGIFSLSHFSPVLWQKSEKRGKMERFQSIVDASLVRFANVPVRCANKPRYSLCRLLWSTLLCSLHGPYGYGPACWLYTGFWMREDVGHLLSPANNRLIGFGRKTCLSSFIICGISFVLISIYKYRGLTTLDNLNPTRQRKA